MSGDFSERAIAVDGIEIRCLEGGAGETVVSLHGTTGAAPTALERLLAEKFRVVALERAAFAKGAADVAGLLAAALAAAGVGKHALLASGAAAAAALPHAAEAAAPPEALVLIAPAADKASVLPCLADIRAPTLILVGTKADPATEAAARLLAERIPEAYPMVVYDAGEDLAAERPAALFEAIADFLERHGRFILERQESVILP